MYLVHTSRPKLDKHNVAAPKEKLADNIALQI